MTLPTLKKVVKSLGGAVEFRLPRSWKVDAEDDETLRAYRPPGRAGILRLTVFRMSPVDGKKPGTFDEQAQKLGATIESLSGGVRLYQTSDRSEEDGEEQDFYSWKLEYWDGRRGTIAIFSFNRRASLHETPEAQRDLSMLERVIRAAKFHIGQQQGKALETDRWPPQTTQPVVPRTRRMPCAGLSGIRRLGLEDSPVPTQKDVPHHPV